MKKQSTNTRRLATAGALLGLAVAGTTALRAQDSAPAPAAPAPAVDPRVAQLEKENQAMMQRLQALEAMSQKEGLLPSGETSSKGVMALSDVSISGFVTASFFHDTDNPSPSGPTGGVSPGYLWNRYNDSFAVNKIKLTLASPAVERSGDKFEAAFRVSFIYGQDAPIVDKTSGPVGTAGNVGFADLREAYVEMNVPIGTGLNVKAGELISLLNYESGDGGAANNNFSQGYQWYFTGNPPATGVQLGYNLTDTIDVKARVVNGIYVGPVDNNNSKTFMGAIGWKPTDKIWFSFVGFAGREDSFVRSVQGGSMLAGWQATPELGFGTELDYFHFSNPNTAPAPGHAPVYSAGLWTSYDFTKKVGVGLRGEFLSDSHGVDASGGALGFLNPAGYGQDLTSVALTLNYKPLPYVKIQPEIRFDHTSDSKYGFVNGKENRFIFGAGATYLF